MSKSWREYPVRAKEKKRNLSIESPSLSIQSVRGGRKGFQEDEYLRHSLHDTLELFGRKKRRGRNTFFVTRQISKKEKMLQNVAFIRDREGGLTKCQSWYHHQQQLKKEAAAQNLFAGMTLMRPEKSLSLTVHVCVTDGIK